MNWLVTPSVLLVSAVFCFGRNLTMTKRPYGIRMCESLCQRLGGCTSFQLRTWSLSCSVISVMREKDKARKTPETTNQKSEMIRTTTMPTTFAPETTLGPGVAKDTDGNLCFPGDIIKIKIKCPGCPRSGVFAIFEFDDYEDEGINMAIMCTSRGVVHREFKAGEKFYKYFIVTKSNRVRPSSLEKRLDKANSRDYMRRCDKETWVSEVVFEDAYSKGKSAGWNLVPYDERC